MHLGTVEAQGGRPLGGPPTRIDAEAPAVIGFRADGRLIVLHAGPCKCELREYGKYGRLVILGTFAGARQVSCELGERLRFWIDGDEVASLPGGKGWTLYRV